MRYLEFMVTIALGTALVAGFPASAQQAPSKQGLSLSPDVMALLR